jgi:hypothetical protein
MGGRRVTVWVAVKVFFLWGVIGAISAGGLVITALLVWNYFSPAREGASVFPFIALALGVFAAPIGFVIGGIAGVIWSPDLR